MRIDQDLMAPTKERGWPHAQANNPRAVLFVTTEEKMRGSGGRREGRSIAGSVWAEARVKDSWLAVVVASSSCVLFPFIILVAFPSRLFFFLSFILVFLFFILNS